MVYILVLFVLFVGGGWLVGKMLGNLFFPDSDDEIYTSNSKDTYIDKSVHHHFHVHDSSKSREIHELGKYADSLNDETIDIDHEVK